MEADLAVDVYDGTIEVNLRHTDVLVNLICQKQVVTTSMPRLPRVNATSTSLSSRLSFYHVPLLHPIKHGHCLATNYSNYSSLRCSENGVCLVDLATSDIGRRVLQRLQGVYGRRNMERSYNITSAQSTARLLV